MDKHTIATTLWAKIIAFIETTNVTSTDSGWDIGTALRYALLDTGSDESNPRYELARNLLASCVVLAIKGGVLTTEEAFEADPAHVRLIQDGSLRASQYRIEANGLSYELREGSEYPDIAFAFWKRLLSAYVAEHPSGKDAVPTQITLGTVWFCLSSGETPHYLPDELRSKVDKFLVSVVAWAVFSGMLEAGDAIYTPRGVHLQGAELAAANNSSALWNRPAITLAAVAEA